MHLTPKINLNIQRFSCVGPTIRSSDKKQGNETEFYHDDDDDRNKDYSIGLFLVFFEFSPNQLINIPLDLQ